MQFLPLLKALAFRNVPVYVHYGVTHRCNLTCKMCGLWKQGDKSTEMTAAQVDAAAENFRKLGTSAISLGGGEPFLRQDLPDIIMSFKSRGIEPRVLTNGLVKDDSLRQRVADTGLRHISISLDTADPVLQDEICGRTGAWKDIMEAAGYWAEVIRPRRGLGVFNCVIGRHNFRTVASVIAIAERFGFYVSLVPIEHHAYHEKELSCREHEDMYFTEEDKLDLKRALSRLKISSLAGSVFNSVPYISRSYGYLTHEPFPFRCRAGALSFSVSPEGLYSMCHYYKGMGDNSRKYVFEPDFTDWYKRENPAAKTAAKAAGCRRCFRPCWQEVNLAFTHPWSLLHAARLRFPKRIPDQLPSPEDLMPGGDK